MVPPQGATTECALALFCSVLCGRTPLTSQAVSLTRDPGDVPEPLNAVPPRTQNPTCVPLTGFLIAPRSHPCLGVGLAAPAGRSFPLNAGAEFRPRAVCAILARAGACALRPTAKKVQNPRHKRTTPANTALRSRAARARRMCHRAAQEARAARWGQARARRVCTPSNERCAHGGVTSRCCRCCVGRCHCSWPVARLRLPRSRSVVAPWPSRPSPRRHTPGGGMTCVCSWGGCVCVCHVPPLSLSVCFPVSPSNTTQGWH